MDELSALVSGGGILGILLGLVVFAWAVASVFLPFIVWGIHSQTSNTAKELRQIKKLLKDGALQVSPE